MGTLIQNYQNRSEKESKGYQAISLSHLTDVVEPKVQAGSVIEVAGALYEFQAEEALTGWAGIANSSVVYTYVVPAGVSCSATFSTTAPTWDTAKQGWYNGENRCFGGLYKDGGGNYSDKWLYREHDQTAGVRVYASGTIHAGGAIDSDSTIHADGAIDSDTTVTADGGIDAGGSGTFLKKKVILIGDWNMDSTRSINVAHGLTFSKIRNVVVSIRNDTNNSLYVMGGGYIDEITHHYVSLGSVTVDGTNVGMDRGVADGSFTAAFDGTAFDSTAYNRGWIVIEYEA